MLKELDAARQFRFFYVSDCLLQDVRDVSDYYSSWSSGANETLKKYNIEVCAPRWKDHIPCLDNAGALAKLRASTRGEIWERHCPRRGTMCCLIAAPRNYKLPIRWPKSRDEVSLPYSITIVFISVGLVVFSF